jgi:crotonobetainyl-CoA:carnitine CoA-transferase CaiB-like acyl-CoA transferase
MSALAGVRVIELADERTAFAGRLLSQLGADVIAVEPPEGSALRHRPPFAGDDRDVDRSLRWWSMAAGKRSVVADLSTDAGRTLFSALVRTADVVLEGVGTPLDEAGVGWEAHAGAEMGLIWVTITPFGRDSARAAEPTTDLTLLAGGGPLWNCGYDDHSLPPIRGAGGQAFNIGGLYASIGALTALNHRDRTGEGQRVDVDINAACNVSSEHATYNWLLIGATVLRQTGRHAMYFPTARVQVQCADGRYATTGVLPTKPMDLGRLHRWLADLGVLDELPEAIFLEMAANRDEPFDLALLGVDDEVTAVMSAAAVALAASHLPAMEFFVQGQQRGFPVGAVLAPDEGFDDPHFVARDFHARIHHPELGQTWAYPGPPYLFGATPCEPPTRPPLLDEQGADLAAAGGDPMGLGD